MPGQRGSSGSARPRRCVARSSRCATSTYCLCGGMYVSGTDAPEPMFPPPARAGIRGRTLKGVLQMRVGIRGRLAAGEICTALLLAVPVAMVIPGGDVALSQNASGPQAPLFTAIDLTPSGFTVSRAFGTSGAEQVGSGAGPATGYQTHALLWRGSAANVVDLNPSGFDESEAASVCGGQQVGHGSGPVTGDATHALVWGGSAASVVDLHPRGFVWSRAYGVFGGQQVGVGSRPATGPYRNEHALLWRGSAASVVDLHPLGFILSLAHGVSGGQQVGDGVQQVGDGVQTHVGNARALLWRGSTASVTDLYPSRYGSYEVSGTNGEEQVGRASQHALLWRGSGASVVDFHTFLPPGFLFSTATAIDSNGDVVGYAHGADPDLSHAFLWKRNVPKPSTSREQNTTGC